ncbi:NADH-quinone oxidoreductase subunit L [Daejeonella lutea]|uniref:NADH-quinone oxidoreductase subunit L n=1 Tax=Daejeonella lutea TaxID=572036 RepID=A0A1T5A1E5_9SPHI|nr:NADH-quinone oxidoreductase subunit L [Daejeonella lutea]SKB28665.1 NADH-quinone oxidoreductase subunit L [Daejeonella lutea]
MDFLTFSANTLCLLSLIALVFPFSSFLVILQLKKSQGATISIFNISVSLIASLLVFINVWNSTTLQQQVEWFQVGTVSISAGILLNNLSVLMMVLVSAISLLVHIYSISYMKGDENIYKYWAYLGLFCFSMMGLVISDSLLLIYMFWELVGMSSYLLIGFWFTKDAASQAAKKAFIMNRIGDLGFLTGLMIIYSQFGTFDIGRLFNVGGLVDSASIINGFWISESASVPVIWLTIAGLAFFIGAMTKSAQFPLHTWLPDAMQGPTSVSSLIHAATMVAAGVFLLGRVYPLFDSIALNTITVVGVFTAFMAATIALTQNDIKRILAYSTISQLGFMIAAMGIGAYGESIFHLATHAFFKCLLFLAAGSVIHQLHHYKEHHSLEFNHQDIRLMGGLRKQMPIAFITMCIAAAALAGLPFTSGFLSKDAILITSFEWAEGYHGFKKLVPFVLVLTSWLTVFYIGRLIFKVFFGKSNYKGVKDAPWPMTRILLILAFFSLFPLFSVNPLSYDNSWLLQGFVPAGVKPFDIFHLLVPIIVTGISAIIVLISYKLYGGTATKQLPENGLLYRFSNRAWYLDRVYDLLFVRSITALSIISHKFDTLIVDGLVNSLAGLARIISDIIHWFDRHVVDGLVNGIASLASKTGDFARQFQTGKLQHYLITMLTLVVTFFIITYLI